MMSAIRIQDHVWLQWIGGAWLVLLTMAWGPAVERTLLPVVTPFQIVSIEPDGSGSRVYVRFEKKRSCEYLGMTWELILPDGTKRRAFLNLKPADDDSGSTRPKGPAIAGPWYVGLTPDQITGHSIANIAYRCHPFWATIIQVWP
jgi:hypothetical protein